MNCLRKLFKFKFLIFISVLIFYQSNYVKEFQALDLTGEIYGMNDFALTNKRGRLIGIVTDGDTRNPVEGALVTVLDGEKTYSQTTDSFGRYVINNLDIGDYIIEISLENYVGEGPVSLSINGDETVRDFVITRQKGDITGKIIDSKKNALALVSIVLSDGINDYTTTTDENGIFTISDVYSGHYDMIASLSGFEDKRFTNLLIQSENILIQDFELRKRTGSLSGAIKDSSNDNHLSGVSIFLSDGTNNYFTTTDAFGIYSFEDIEFGEYTLTTSLEKYDSKSININIQTFVSNAQDVFISKRVGKISGRITDFINGNNIDNAKITSTDGVNYYVTYSDFNGYYEFNDIELGRYKLTIDFGNYDLKTVDDVVVTDLDITFKDIQIQNSKGILRGRVKDLSGNSLRDAQVEIFNDDKHYILITDSNGNYTIDNIEEGIYIAIASKTNYSQTEIYDLKVLRGNITTQDFDLEAISGTVFGKITDINTGVPIDFAYIMITNDDNTITTLADANGDYSMNFVPQGNYSVIASAYNYDENIVDDVIISKGNSTKVDIALGIIVSDELNIDSNLGMQSPMIIGLSGTLGGTSGDTLSITRSSTPIITPETPTEQNDSVTQPIVELLDLDVNVIKGTGIPGDIIEIIFSDGTRLETTVLGDGTWSIILPHLGIGDVILIHALDPLTGNTSANVNVSIVDSPLPSTGEYVDHYWMNFTVSFLILLSILYFLMVTRKMTK